MYCTPLLSKYLVGQCRFDLLRTLAVFTPAPLRPAMKIQSHVPVWLEGPRIVFGSHSYHLFCPLDIRYTHHDEMISTPSLFTTRILSLVFVVTCHHTYFVRYQTKVSVMDGSLIGGFVTTSHIHHNGKIPRPCFTTDQCCLISSIQLPYRLCQTLERSRSGP